MAKQSVGPLIRHIDKAILGVAGVILLLAIAQFGVVSPNKIESDGEMLDPSQVDDDTREKADALRNQLRQAKVEQVPYEDPMVRITELVDPVSAAGIDRMMARAFVFPPLVPTLEGGIITTNKHDLVKVVQIGRPVLTSGRSGAYLVPPDDLGGGGTGNRKEATFLRDVNWVTVSAPFNRAQQELLANSAGYDPKRVGTIFTGADLERRTLNADGSFSEWEPVEPVARQVLPTLPAPEVYKVEGGEGFNVSEDDRADISQFESIIQQHASQLALMRPLFPIVEYGSNWRYPRGFDADVTDMDVEFLEDTQGCRYPECAATSKDSDKDKTVKQLLKEAEEELADGNFQRADKLVGLAAKETDVSRGEERKIKQLQKDIEIAKAKAGSVKKERLPQQVIWAHDAGVKSLESGRTYQYRMRARIYNQYCGTAPLLNDPQNAALVELIGPWSEPSEPVTIERDTIFFVRSGNEKKQNCKVDLYKWVAGQWIQKSFTLTIDAPIGEEVTRVKTHRNERDTVDFSTGATLIDIEFSHPYWSKDKRNGRSKKADKTTAITYVDASGQLYQQLEEFDEGSELYKYYKENAWDPPRK